MERNNRSRHDFIIVPLVVSVVLLLLRGDLARADVVLLKDPAGMQRLGVVVSAKLAMVFAYRSSRHFLVLVGALANLAGLTKLAEFTKLAELANLADVAKLVVPLILVVAVLAVLAGLAESKMFVVGPCVSKVVAMATVDLETHS